MPRKKIPKVSAARVRIIGGTWRGRLLSFTETEGLRPTGNRIRETLFNWLMPVLPGARCLDLFAGSGALGFEALSRGAAHCSFCETHNEALTHLRKNAEMLGANACILPQSALNYLNTKAEPFDIVFIDPPFSAELWQSTLELLEAQHWLRDGAFIYVESPKHWHGTVPQNWSLHRDKSAGAVHYQLYQKETNTP